MADKPTYDFASRDYSNIRRDLMARASRAVPEWTDRDPSDFATAMVDLWAYMGDIFHYYIDWSAQEAFLDTATQKESVMGFANLFDYTPRFRYPATGYVQVTNSGSASVTLPQYGTSFSGKYDDTLITCYPAADTVIEANTSTQVPVVEGKIIGLVGALPLTAGSVTGEVLTSSAGGTIGQRYALANTTVVPETVRVFVLEDGNTPTEWTRVTNVNSVAINQAAFSVYPSSTGEFEVVFGNRLSGRIPPTGSQIIAVYATCTGSAGNVPAGSFTGFYSAPPSGLSVTGSSALTSGYDSESVDSVKKSLKSVIKTRDRFVTLQDFQLAASRVDGVAKAVASYNSGTVTIHAMPPIGGYTSYAAFSASVPAAVASDIVDTLTAGALLGVTVATSAVTIHKVNITATVYVNPNYRNSMVLTDVQTALDSLFDLSALEIGTAVPIGDVYRTAMSVSGVDYITVSTYEIRNSANSVVTSLGATEMLKKGTFTLTATGGVTT